MGTGRNRKKDTGYDVVDAQLDSDGVINADAPTVLPPRFLERGRVANRDTDENVVVIEEGSGGTTFTPREGKTCCDELE